MTKKYNISSKSDMRRFQRDLEKTVIKEAKSTALKGKYETSCPHCGYRVTVRVGINSCPHCRNDIEFSLNFD